MHVFQEISMGIARMLIKTFARKQRPVILSGNKQKTNIIKKKKRKKKIRKYFLKWRYPVKVYREVKTNKKRQKKMNKFSLVMQLSRTIM